MRTIALSAFLLTILIVAVSVANVSNEKHGSSNKTVVGEWSKPVNGLSARLKLQLEEITISRHPSCYRYEIMLETKNVQGELLAVTSQPSFVDIKVTDADGKEVPNRGYRQSGPIPFPQWGHIPGAAYMGVRVDMTTVGLSGGSALVGLDDYVRYMNPGTYTLQATLVAEKDDKGPDNQWTGKIKLQPVTFTFELPKGA